MQLQANEKRMQCSRIAQNKDQISNRNGTKFEIRFRQVMFGQGAKLYLTLI